MVALTEKLLTIAQVQERVPGRDGQPVHAQTIRSWMKRGRRGVRLESIIIGGVRFTSEEAIGRFVAALNPEMAKATPKKPKGESASRKQLRSELGI